MKVLMLGWELPPHNSGGLGVACYQLCQALAHKGVDIEFIVPYSAQHSANFMKITAARPVGVSEVVRGGIAYDSYRYVLEDGREEWHDIYDQQALYEAAVARMAFETEYDIVHAHDWLTFRAALRLKLARGVPIVLHVHSVESDRAGGKRGNPLVHEIEELGFQMADKIVAVSELTKQAIIRDYNIPASKIDVVHNSIDQTSIEPLDSNNSYAYLAALKEQGYRIVTNVGRLTIQKGLPNLIMAAKEVIRRVPKTMFLIVGSGEQYHELIELAANAGIGRNVVFTGFQRGKRWRDAYAIADLFVMPSVSEPFGLTPLEAIAYGTPSLVSKQSGVSEVLHNCLKVDFWDIEEMANQIASVVQHDVLRDAILAGARTEFANLTWNNAADQIKDIYNKHLVGAVT
ncbi:MAG TPA: glycosyltransferase family 4 protein [Candidatus Saccharimonadales bacterium]|nr:glycosyltransferase family 4 protein [Candidatus Saccharimonadales bacterium]